MSAVVTAKPRNRAMALDQDAVHIGSLYREARKSAVESARQLIEAGRRLAEKRKSLAHGEWLPWLAANAEVLGFQDRSTASRLMAAAKKWCAGAPSDEAEALEVGRAVWGHSVHRTDTGGPIEWFTPAETITRVEEIPPPDRWERPTHRRERPKRRKRIPNTLISGWQDVKKFRDIVRHNLQVEPPRYANPKDIDHDRTVGAVIMVSPASIQELDRVAALHSGMNRQEIMEEAVEVLCSALRDLRLEQEARIEREQRQKYEAAMAEKRAREARGEAGAAT
jgi:hypothetical protein